MRTEYKYVFYDEDGTITKLIRCTENTYTFNIKDGEGVLKVSRDTNVPLDAKVINGEII